MRSVKVWVADHPMPRPGVTAYHAMKTREIGLWADMATADTRPQDKKLRALIVALANESTTAMSLTTAGELIAKRYPRVGSQQEVHANMRWLTDHGWLLQNGERTTARMFTVPHYRLGRHKGVVRPR